MIVRFLNISAQKVSLSLKFDAIFAGNAAQVVELISLLFIE